MASFRVRSTHLSHKPRGSSASVVLASLVFFCVASGLYWEKVGDMFALLPATREAVFSRYELWRLLTTMAVHGDLKHLVSNALPFALFGFFVHGYFGYWAFPFWTFVLGCFVTGLALATYPPTTTLIGASGIVYMIAAFWLTMYVLVHRVYSFPQRVLRSVGFALILFVPRTYEPGISYRTHAIGFAIGVLWALVHFLLHKQQLRNAEHVEFEETEN